jgi:hypothetical protein
LDGPLPKWCPAVALSHQDGRHSAVALFIESSFDPGERLQAPGSLWLKWPPQYRKYSTLSDIIKI